MRRESREKSQREPQMQAICRHFPPDSLFVVAHFSLSSFLFFHPVLVRLDTSAYHGTVPDRSGAIQAPITPNGAPRATIMGHACQRFALDSCVVSPACGEAVGGVGHAPCCGCSGRSHGAATRTPGCGGLLVCQLPGSHARPQRSARRQLVDGEAPSAWRVPWRRRRWHHLLHGPAESGNGDARRAARLL